ncbi:UNVERIFIED_CONTAM: hypothetical protein FKN15_050950 [Acipenser sinensis]
MDPVTYPCRSGAGQPGDGGQEDFGGRPLSCSNPYRRGAPPWLIQAQWLPFCSRTSYNKASGGWLQWMVTGQLAPMGEKGTLTIHIGGQMLKHPVRIAPVQDLCILGPEKYSVFLVNYQK